MSETAETLILAWGNPGRLDDGLGPALARAATRWSLEHVEIHSNYQLQVEDAEDASRCGRVVFVDADRAGREPFSVERVHPAPPGIRFSSHSVSPGSLLALARDLFRAEPEAWVVGIRGYEFDEFGEGLSERAKNNLEAAAAWVRGALQSGEFHEVR